MRNRFLKYLQSKKYFIGLILIVFNIICTFYVFYQYDTQVGKQFSKKQSETKINSKEEAIRQKLQQRITQIKNRCKHMNNTSPLRFDSIEREAWPWIYVSHKYKILYCQTPKVGSTHWMNIFGILEGHTNGTQDKVIHGTQLMLLSYLSVEERARVLEKYTKFVVIREPFKRLFSAYKDKLLPFNKYNMPLFSYLSQKIVYEYRTKNSTFHEHYPTLEEFIKYVTDSSKHATEIKLHYSENRHWKPQVDICYPCNIDYDFVLDIQNIEEETQHFFKAAGIPRIVTYPKRNKPSNSSTRSQKIVFDDEIQSQFSKVDPTLIKTLYHYYEKDYNVLGFPAPPQF